MNNIKGARAVLAAVGLLLGMALLDCGARRPSTETPPEAPATPLDSYNILLIMTDDQNARALGCYGNPEIRTPHIDRLAGQGVRFDRAFCQTAQCCPSRYSVLTGRYAHSHGLRYNGVMENPDEVTLAEIMKAAGYATAVIGKHHMQQDPRLHGFEEVVGMDEYRSFLETGNAPNYLASGNWLGPEVKRATGYPAGMTHTGNDLHPSGFWAGRAIQFLEQHGGEPFFLWLSFNSPHVPYVASAPWSDWYDPLSLTLPGNFKSSNRSRPYHLLRLRQRFRPLNETQMRRILACYYAAVSQIDFNVGRVLDELDRLGLDDRTIVIFVADHGDMMGEHGVFLKAALNYEATVRVPLIIRAPGVAGGRTIQELAALIDLLPTLCGMTGQSSPEGVQGRSLVPLLEGRETEWREVVFS